MDHQDSLQIILSNAINLGADAASLTSVLLKQARAELDVNPWKSGHEILGALIHLGCAKLEQADANHPVTSQLRMWFTRMDAIVEPAWGGGTLQNSFSRRQRITDLLQLDDALRELVDRHFPPFLEGNVIIAREHKPWFTKERKQNSSYYGQSLLEYLTSRGFRPETVVQIDQATDQTLDLLADPTQEEVYSARGLVVGYVQSGKTTNINVLIAKAIDTGYRLIIVFAGTTNVLRDQTQRRFDKEVVGKQIIDMDPEEREGSGYLFQADWNEFIVHPNDPSRKITAIERLTARRKDFEGGAVTFTSDWINNGKSARVLIMKKIPLRIQKVTNELKRLSKEDKRRIPALIIDDESDQASVNTVKPTPLEPGELKKRNATNAAIVELLNQLPRSQYVGYTATPFANILIDAEDAMDLFPKDFIISLSQPADYMGLRKFHDLDEEFMPVLDVDPENSNQARHVRDIYTNLEGDHDIKLLQAIDLYVLTGAIKLFRESVGTGKFRHHTMFYTDSTFLEKHEEARQRIEKIWKAANYSTHIGIQRLEDLYESDLVKHSQVRSDSGYFPESFADIRPLVDAAIHKIEQQFNGYSRILVVNSDQPHMTPDFEMEPIWKIIVGGAKLSRGYTIEGLTITFFCRNSTAADTLMQMGRWFGYRRGYEDLVRLFISRDQTLSKNGKETLDLYEAFQDMCRDEESLRRQLRKYTELRADGSRITPREIPPLIQCSHPKLRPAQPNKMWNAVIQSRNFGPGRFAIARTSEEPQSLELNRSLFESLLAQLRKTKIELRNDGTAPALLFDASIEQINLILESMKWHDEAMKADRLQEVRLFLDFLSNPENAISNWRIVVPLTKGDSYKAKPWTISPSIEIPIVGRTWKPDQRAFKTIADPKHRDACYAIANADQVKDSHLLSPDVKQLQEIDGTAVLLLYAVRRLIAKGQLSDDPTTPAMCMEFFLPKNRMAAVGFTVNSPSNPDAISVPIHQVLAK